MSELDKSDVALLFSVLDSNGARFEKSMRDSLHEALDTSSESRALHTLLTINEAVEYDASRLVSVLEACEELDVSPHAAASNDEFLETLVTPVSVEIAEPVNIRDDVAIFADLIGLSCSVYATTDHKAGASLIQNVDDDTYIIATAPHLPDNEYTDELLDYVDDSDDGIVSDVSGSVNTDTVKNAVKSLLLICLPVFAGLSFAYGGPLFAGVAALANSLLVIFLPSIIEW